MLRSYFLISWRTLLRNKIFSLINIMGLAIGLAVSFVIYQYIQVELSYDKFHENADRLYRVPISYSGSFSSIKPSATNHPAVGPALKADFPEVKDYARLVRASLFIPAATVSFEKTNSESVRFNEESIYLADESFLKIFSFKIVEGDASALKEPVCLAITKEIAVKYFGDNPALGKTLTINGQNFKVTAVLEDIPQNSHLQFDILISFSTLGENWGIDEWKWPEFYNYVLLNPGVDPQRLKEKFPAFAERYLGKIWEEHKFRSAISLQPITDIHLKSNLGLEQSINGSEDTVYFLTILALLVMIVAWINYVNLSTAKSLERSKEVGVRKASGASRKQLVIQFFIDALMVNVLAVLVAFALLIVGIPYFEQLVGKNITAMLAVSGSLTSWSFWSIAIASLLIGIMVIGIYPAMIISSFNPAIVLKGKYYKSQSGIVLRRSLVGFQYALSISLIAGTLAISQQLEFMQQQDLGYNKDQLLVVRAAAIFDSTYTQQIQYFKNQLSGIASVESIASSSEVPGQGIGERNSVRRAEQDESDNVGTFFYSVDDAFIRTYGMNLSAGRNFSETDRFVLHTRDKDLVSADGYLVGGGQNKIVINEELATRLGFAKPEEAVNQIVKLRLGDEYASEVIGVLKNHHQLSLKEKYDPIVYYYPSFEYWKFFSIRLTPGDYHRTIDDVRKAYGSAFPGNAFEYFFLDDHFNEQYQADLRFGKIFKTFTALAIIIACLGLFGLGLFAVTQRTKEIGIRKVLGASVSTILILFSKESIKLVLIAYVFCIPLIYFAARGWLDKFAFHIKLGWEIFLIPPLLLIVISILTIISICLRTALQNPARALKYE